MPRKEPVLTQRTRTREELLWFEEDIEVLAEYVARALTRSGRGAGLDVRPAVPDDAPPDPIVRRNPRDLEHPIRAMAAEAIREAGPAVDSTQSYQLYGSPSTIGLLQEELVQRNPNRRSVTDWRGLELVKSPNVDPYDLHVATEEGAREQGWI